MNSSFDWRQADELFFEDFEDYETVMNEFYSEVNDS